MNTKIDTQIEEAEFEVKRLTGLIEKAQASLKDYSKQLVELKAKREAEQQFDAGKAKLIVEKLGQMWGGTWDAPEYIDVKFTTYGNEDCILITISKSYNAPKLTFAILKKMSEYFETDRLDTFDEFSNSGCDTCDYGSSYGYFIRVLPATVGGKLDFQVR